MHQVAVRPETEAKVEEPASRDLIGGRPAEDWSFELVEVTAGAAAGLAIGSAVAGPFGTLVGGVVGAAAGLLTGEAWEAAAGRTAATTDAAAPEPDERA